VADIAVDEVVELALDLFAPEGWPRSYCSGDL
jgi:hypothetical protein